MKLYSAMIDPEFAGRIRIGIRLIFLSALVVVVLFYRVPKAAAVPYCDYEIDYYSDDSLSNQVGQWDTMGCIKVNHWGTVTDNYIETSYGSCDDGCSIGESCSCEPYGASDFCKDGVCSGWEY